MSEFPKGLALSHFLGGTVKKTTLYIVSFAVLHHDALADLRSKCDPWYRCRCHLDGPGDPKDSNNNPSYKKKSGHFHFHFLQGNVLANNSDPTTITRNSGVFWAMNMSSNFIGNTLAFLLFKVRYQQNYQHFFSFDIPAKRYYIKKCTYRIWDNTTTELNQFSKFLL